MKRQTTRKINTAIVESRSDAFDWPLCRLSSELYWWTEFFNTAFFKNQPVPIPILSFEKKSVKNLGHYQKERNGFGLKENININQWHLDRPLWEILVILIHEMCHSWQTLYGNPSKSWFHNREFQMKMLEFGIVCNNKGCHLGVGDPFVFLLKRHGIALNLNRERDGIMKIPPTPKKKGKSKLKKWTCGCTNIRVAVSDLEAKCLKCGNRFDMVT